MKEDIEQLLEDLLFPSESDEPVDYISFENIEGDEPLTLETFRCLVALPENAPIEERDPTSFWSIVTEYHEWYDDFEQRRTETFQKIKLLLEGHLTGIQYFEVGEIEVKLFVLGRSEDKIQGITTTAVRT